LEDGLQRDCVFDINHGDQRILEITQILLTLSPSTDYHHSGRPNCDSDFCLFDHIRDYAGHHGLSKYDHYDKCYYEHSTGFDLYSIYYYRVYGAWNHEHLCQVSNYFFTSLSVSAEKRELQLAGNRFLLEG
jgi:hypothetical protein